jgi:hypothetical protein
VEQALQQLPPLRSRYIRSAAARRARLGLGTARRNDPCRRTQGHRLPQHYHRDHQGPSCLPVSSPRPTARAPRAVVDGDEPAIVSVTADARGARNARFTVHAVVRLNARPEGRRYDILVYDRLMNDQP